ncbi:SMP-30/gluconolactonase/LRE family protein [Candidatus Rariloculus sp.]|uniref:SMP-30/gluconolactonase/LRE family protein n=1 Tax=Candidatus Rariloculus sp. TaxID=3101265 RepID=UPI003D14A824
MKPTIALALLAACASTTALAQNPASAFDRGNSIQAWQHPGLQDVLAECSNAPSPFSIGRGQSASVDATASPPEPAPPPPSTAIPGVIAAGQTWKVVWSWEGNNADGIVAGNGSAMLFANNDASNVMELDPGTGRATVLYSDTNTGGALSRSKTGALFLAVRGLGVGIEQLEPRREMFASSFAGEPLECVGGVMNDLAADVRGGVYFTVSGGGLFYANSQGIVSQYGEGVTRGNGIVLSPDEEMLYVTNGPVVLAFDVISDGSLANQREFGALRGGQGGDGSAVDSEGRLYVATGASADVFSPDGELLGSIPGPQGLHGVAFGGPDKMKLYGIVFYGGWGTPSARNRVIEIPTIAQGYMGRAK